MELDINPLTLYLTSVTVTILTYFFIIHKLNQCLRKEFPNEDYKSSLFDSTLKIMLTAIAPFYNCYYTVTTVWDYYDIRDELIETVKQEQQTIKELVEQIKEQYK
jgi:hypothetical protein